MNNPKIIPMGSIPILGQTRQERRENERKLAGEIPAILINLQQQINMQNYRVDVLFEALRIIGIPPQYESLESLVEQAQKNIAARQALLAKPAQ